jgi:ABC-type dipeptide/oligopeptide/nickel transport system permease component
MVILLGPLIAHAFRKVLWTVPKLIAVSLLAFWLVSHVQVPTPAGTDEATARRERFLDLPRFLNFSPVDVRSRAHDAAFAIVAGGASGQAGRREIARLGIAAFPYLLPLLDTLPPEPRARVALALAPVAERMGIDGRHAASDPTRAIAFWTRFWDDRGIELHETTVRSAVARLVRRGSEDRVRALEELDTFVLDDLLAAIDLPVSVADLPRLRPLVEIAAHVTGRDDRIPAADDLDAARACVFRWKRFWAVYRSDFIPLTGAARGMAVFVETRYGKWALSMINEGSTGMGDGARVVGDLLHRGPKTLGLVLCAILLAYSLAVPLAVLVAALMRRRVELAPAYVLLALYATPTAALAAVAQYRLGGRLLTGALVLATGLLAAPTLQLADSLAGARPQEYCQAALARGTSSLRTTGVHALRRALLPVLTLATLEGPLALGGAFVVERAFHLEGVGESTIAAVRSGDQSWLMAISIAGSVLASLCIFASDLAHAAVDPRLPLVPPRARS